MSLELLNWRRQVHALYADVRAAYADSAPNAHAHWRAVRDRLYREHPQSPLTLQDRATFTGLRYWPYDPALAFMADVEPAEHETWPLGTSHDGTTMVVTRIGTVNLPVGRLAVWWMGDYAGGLFLPLRDGTAGDGSYGGGRYVLDTGKGADLGSSEAGALVLDLNFAYHPSCYYDPRWACPLAGPDNRTEVRVEAGERVVP